MYCIILYSILFFLFFFNDTATTEIYTLSLHDALPISFKMGRSTVRIAISMQASGLTFYFTGPQFRSFLESLWARLDRKSTRLNSSHANISYAVFCLKKKKNNKTIYIYIK